MDSVSRSETPVAILSYNRPHMLQEVLESLMNQNSLVPQECFHLFQDGARVGTSENQKLTDECVDVFKKICPQGILHVSAQNIGTARNFERAERHMFEVLRAPVAFFFEDDMIVSKSYIAILESLAKFALESDRIAQFAAYGIHHLSEKQQFAMGGKIVAMHHAWGYGITRNFWLRQQPIVEGYLQIIAGKDYKLRQHDQIRRYFESLGVLCYATSQDTAKRAAAGILGAARITCAEVHGKYIGIEGDNYDAALYDAHGFSKTILYSGEHRPIQKPSEEFLASMVCSDITAMTKDYYLTMSEQLGVIPDLQRSISSIYRGLLHREPDRMGAQSMIAALNSGTPLHSILEGVVESSEFKEKFSARNIARLKN